jgi:Domain of unknown function (DUF4145)
MSDEKQNKKAAPPTDLSTLAGFDAHLSVYFNQGSTNTPTAVGEVYCPGCGAMRSVDAFIGGAWNRQEQAARLVFLTCRQCAGHFTLLRFISSSGPEVACLPRVNGGISTPKTPPPVAYYLDQAHRANCLGARSAAVAMYRAALEHLLYEQKFTDGMLDKKIKDLEAAIKDGTAPKWARELDTEYLHVIKLLGNGSIHPNGGDIGKQASFDTSLVAAVETLFADLLVEVYEIDKTRQERLARLKSVAVGLKR